MTHGPSDPLYKGEPLDAARGPGLGCFWIQVAILGVLLVVTPLSVAAAMPELLSATLLIATLILLLFTGQTIIFLLRLVAADRRTRRRPMSATARQTVGDLEAGMAAGAAATVTATEPAWSELDLPPTLRSLYEAAASEARARLERDQRLATFAVAEDEAGLHRMLDAGAARDATRGSRAAAIVTDARLRLPGLRRPTEAIRIDLETRDGIACVAAIRYESEGPPRYRYWPPVMAETVPTAFAQPLTTPE